MENSVMDFLTIEQVRAAHRVLIENDIPPIVGGGGYKFYELFYGGKDGRSHVIEVPFKESNIESAYAAYILWWTLKT